METLQPCISHPTRHETVRARLLAPQQALRTLDKRQRIAGSMARARAQAGHRPPPTVERPRLGRAQPTPPCSPALLPSLAKPKQQRGSATRACRRQALRGWMRRAWGLQTRRHPLAFAGGCSVARASDRCDRWLRITRACEQCLGPPRVRGVTEFEAPRERVWLPPLLPYANQE